MNFLKRKPQLPNETGDRLARTIADQILHWQNLLAAKMNKGINRYSKQHQKWLLGIFCAVSAGFLVLCLLFPLGKMAIKMPGHNYQTAHIGLPSYLPVAKGHLKTTDSLTTKNK